jgi:peptide/nickel transport system permease protein
MIGWLASRLLQAFFVVIAMMTIVFIGVSVIGDPVAILLPPDADQAEQTRVILALGLDQPLWSQI